VPELHDLDDDVEPIRAPSWAADQSHHPLFPVVEPAMDADRQARCDAWLARLAEWCGGNVGHAPTRRVAIAVEVVRGIVDVTDPEWDAALQWATDPHNDRDHGQPTAADWNRALLLYGPSVTDADRWERAHQCVVAAAHGSRQSMRNAVR
jgi:hypothetical protein